MALSDKQQAFVDYYLANGFQRYEGGRGGRVLRAGPSRPQVVKNC